MRKMTFAVAGILTVVLAAGCASTQRGASDEELIAVLKDACLKSVAAQDIPALLTHFSDTFSCREFPDKEALADFLDSAKQMGYFDGLTISFDTAETTIENGSATMDPVVLDGAFGQITGTFYAEKINGAWMISNMDLMM